MITINNPQTCGLDHNRILELLQLFRPDYFCLADEIAGTGTYHTHIFLYSHSPMRFGTVKRRFPPAHIDKANGTAQENRDYIRKEGKWAETAKAETRVDGSFVEFGSMPTPAEESAPTMFQLLQDVTDVLLLWRSLKTILNLRLRAGILTVFGRTCNRSGIALKAGS